MMMNGEVNLKQRLVAYRNEVSAELGNILNYWINNTVDLVDGGFLGRIDNDNQIVSDSPKGSVLNARILWSFSAAYNQNGRKEYLQMANRAYKYILDYFVDKTYGGVYWSIDHTGVKLDTKKQVYASAFTVYALSEYYKVTKNQEVLNKATSLFRLLVDKAFDWKKTGYFEAFTEDWQPIDDLRLSAKDANEKKTMNTHLHVLEGYTNLYRVWPDKTLRSHIVILINNFLDHFLNQETNHLNLFFDEDWNLKSSLVSYGHDIEAAWLLLESAEVINDAALISRLKSAAVKIAEATIGGMDEDGGLLYEYEPANNHLVKEKHWWVQAEATVGFLNAWEITANERYLRISLKNWEFIKDKILDKRNGEWFWGVYEDGSPMAQEDKVGIWKCPYHNSRACIELINRITSQIPIVSTEKIS